MNTNLITPLILCGGSGTRLWPLSRKSYPKQFLKLAGKHSLLQQTTLRVNNPAMFDSPIFASANIYIESLINQLSEIRLENYSIISEPFAKGTAPATALAAMLTIKKNPEALLLVLSSDHDILNQDKFINAVKNASFLASQGKIISFGLTPTSPETGYGYINLGQAIDARNDIYEIQKFVEKPNKETAQSYITTGEYCWNGGIFLMKASKYLEELQKYRPDIFKICESTLKSSTISSSKIELNKEIFEQCPSDSIDYAVMEQTTNGAVAKVDIGWTDIGSWDMVWEINQKCDNNVFKSGDVIAQDCNDCYIHNNDSSLLATYGLENLIVVKTSNATLIIPKSKAQEVKQLIKTMTEQSRQELHDDHLVQRPWGNYQIFADDNNFKIKRITVKPGAKLSLQSHNHRAEHWVVISGIATVTKGENVFELHANESTYISKQELHRLENKGLEDLHIIEIQTGNYFGEDDIIRYDDVYGRLNNK